MVYCLSVKVFVASSVSWMNMKTDRDRPRSMLPCTCCQEESVERVDFSMKVHLAARLNAKFEAEQHATCIADLGGCR